MTALSRPVRRGFLVAHVVVSVGWLGLTLCLLVLAITGAATGSAATAEAAYRAMRIFGDWLVAPLALSALATGLVLSLGTHWGLVRHRWVLVKFVLTLITATASIFALRAGINEAAAEVTAGRPVPDAGGLVVPPTVALVTYLFMTAVSVLKPWGPTRWGRRHQREQRARRTGDAARGTARKGVARPPAGQPV
ncbi:DUF2269 domain-containing protein [Streptomyces litchfieldiae]|uniref:DUF2269 domain-containing protein n=1 Tax=Streptomyces litchfieldiae TaxID=3075543 RepID=A0ABU2ML89_9ACTN|nr:DUF2269 domain-containing protein [Streptomyces sp. DSM 44938]MDT0342192.1 DUF2269 domain-containing protein [Streptomyces sp. DSM 44938]